MIQLTELQIILVFAGGVIATIGTVYAARIAGRSSVRVKELDVDGKAFERAENIYKSSIERLKEDVKDLKTKADEQGAELKTLRSAIEKITGAFRVALVCIEEFVIWDGSPASRPRIPRALYEHLDPALVARHQRQQPEEQPVPERH